MYASIHRYHAVTAPPDDVIRAGRQSAAALDRLPGFVAYVLLDAGDGVLVAVSLFEDAAGLRATEQLPALGFRPDATTCPVVAGEPSVTSGEVLVQRGL